MDNGLMMNEIIEHTSSMSEGIDIPIICLDYDDDEDVKIDMNYKWFLDYIIDDKNLGPNFETSVNSVRYEVDDNGEESKTRKFDIISKRSSNIGNENVPVVVRAQETESNKRLEISTAREKTERENRVAERRLRKRIVEFEAARRDTSRSLRHVAVASAQQDIHRERKRAFSDRISETKAVGASRVDRVAEVEISRPVPVSQRNKGNQNEENHVVKVDKDYMSYLKWLVVSTTTKQLVQESTNVSEKRQLVQVKEEVVDLEPWSEIIAVSDSPFLDGGGRPFVTSRSVINLDEESKDGSGLFKEELMDVLKKPYDEGELVWLSQEVSRKRPATRYRELRKGREKSCETKEWGPSYLELHSDFSQEYKLVNGADKVKALRLLRGFFFYLVNVCRDGAFKPWKKNKQAA